MGNSKKIWLAFFALVAILIIVSFLHLGEEANRNCVDDCVLVKTDSQPVELQLETPAIKPSQPSQNVQNSATTENDAGTSQNTIKLISNKGRLVHKKPSTKHYDDNWCYANKELSASDYEFAQTELKDWERFIGKARAGNSAMAGRDDTSFPNNSFIESYETLPINQLQEQALQGDKWAMVAFLQDSRPSFAEGDVVKDKIAKMLMVEGGAYYALEHLVLRSLSAANTSISQSKQDEAIEHVTDALAHVFWGLEHFNDGGLGPFIAGTSGESFKLHMQLENLLPSSVEKIRNKLEGLTNRVNEQRAAQGIDMPQAPTAVRKMFAKNIAIIERRAKRTFKLLRSLDIANNDRIASTPCVKKYIADLDEALGQ